MSAGIHQQAVAVHFHVPSAGTDARSRVEVAKYHGSVKIMSVQPVAASILEKIVVGVVRVGM